MTPGPDQSDEQLLRLMTKGDEDAFAALYRRRQGSVYRFALGLCGNQTVAEEATQETFMALIRSAAGLDGSRGSLAAWLLGVARNQVWKCLERDVRYRQFEDGEAEPAANGSPLEDLTRAESIEALRRAILALPPRYREVLVLCDLEEVSYDDAARALECAVGTVRSRLHRARALLAGKMRPEVRCSA